jgi:streptomycin 6-kinase
MNDRSRGLRIPGGLEWLRGSAAGRAWLDAAPALARACAARWSLTLGQAFEGSHVSLALAARDDGGGEVVLKLQFPHPESEHEAEALRAWDGDGAVRLLAHDPERHALLLERARPGRPLSEEDAANALGVLIGLLPRLWKPVAAPFRTLEAEGRRWARALPHRWEETGRPFERRLLDAALSTLAALAAAQRERVLLHQDLHPGNVLRATREPWLVIDPKPLAGERAFSAAPIVRAVELGHDRVRVLRRLDRLSEELGLDRERARGWALAQTLAWAFDASGVIPRHVETARWLLDARR